MAMVAIHPEHFFQVSGPRLAQRIVAEDVGTLLAAFRPAAACKESTPPSALSPEVFTLRDRRAIFGSERSAGHSAATASKRTRVGANKKQLPAA